jgi:hypothetical protein
LPLPDAAFTVPVDLTIGRHLIFRIQHAGASPVSEATMRAEAQKLSDDIEEAFVLLRRSL